MKTVKMDSAAYNQLLTDCGKLADERGDVNYPLTNPADQATIQRGAAAGIVRHFCGGSRVVGKSRKV